MPNRTNIAINEQFTTLHMPGKRQALLYLFTSFFHLPYKKNTFIRRFKQKKNLTLRHVTGSSKLNTYYI